MPDCVTAKEFPLFLSKYPHMELMRRNGIAITIRNHHFDNLFFICLTFHCFNILIAFFINVVLCKFVFGDFNTTDINLSGNCITEISRTLVTANTGRSLSVFGTLTNPILLRHLFPPRRVFLCCKFPLNPDIRF